MINPIKQHFVASQSVQSKGQNKENKEVKEGKQASETSEVSTKAANIKAAIANGDYKIDLKATAKSFADALL